MPRSDAITGCHERDKKLERIVVDSGSAFETKGMGNELRKLARAPDEKSILESLRCQYENHVKDEGEYNSLTFMFGQSFARALSSSNHCIEAERLLTKLADITHQVHGDLAYPEAEGTSVICHGLKKSN